MQVTVEVTQNDIQYGRRKDCDHCPIAKAVGRVLSWDFYAFADEEYISIRHEIRGAVDGFHINTPAVATEFMQAFDSCKPVAPFSFPLDIPTEYLRQPTGAA